MPRENIDFLSNLDFSQSTSFVSDISFNSFHTDELTANTIIPTSLSTVKIADFVTYNTEGIWILKIKDNEILFNTQQLTINEITEQFLKTLETITHKEGLQYTFNF